MYKMVHKITVGSYKLMLLESVKIVRSVDSLADRAEIVLPGMRTTARSRSRTR